MPYTVRFHRVLTAPPEKVYRAFLDPDAKAKWLPPNGFTGKVHEMDARVGGGYRMSFTNFTTGKSHDSVPTTVRKWWAIANSYNCRAYGALTFGQNAVIKW